jgi:hypothetical protein
MLILESDPDCKAMLCAVLAVDIADTSFLAVIDALRAHEAVPATLLLGSVGARVLASAKRTAQSRGLTVLDALARQFDANAVAKLLTPQLSIPPPILREELKRAIAEHELTLHHQPKVTLGTMKVRGVEALVRWQHSRRGLLHPRHEKFPT